MTENKKGIPFIITSDIEKRLKAVGLSVKEITKLPPEEAWKTLKDKEEFIKSLKDVGIISESSNESVDQKNPGKKPENKPLVGRQKSMNVIENFNKKLEEEKRKKAAKQKGGEEKEKEEPIRYLTQEDIQAEYQSDVEAAPFEEGSANVFNVNNTFSALPPSEDLPKAVQATEEKSTEALALEEKARRNEKEAKNKDGEKVETPVAPTEAPEHEIDKNKIAEIEKEINSLKEKKIQKEQELDATTFFKKNKIKKEIKKIEREIEKKEIEKDKEEKLFLYYVAKKVTDKNHYINEETPIDLRKINSNNLTFPFLHKTTQKKENYFDFTISGFTLVIKNINKIRGKDGINFSSDKAIYKIVGPNGETIKDDILGYSEASKFYGKVVEEYDVKMKKEFNSKSLDDIRNEINTNLEKSSEKIETQEEKEVKKEIENLSPEDREKIGWGLNTIGFKVEKIKNDIFAGILFGAIYGFSIEGKDNKWTRVKGIGENGTVGRFCKELRDSFVRDSGVAVKKANDIKSGEEKHRLSNASLLFGNVLRYGRILTDLTGKSIASPLRYVMMAGMATTRLAEAGKETRLKNEEVMEKTRIQDAEIAAEEAWKIYKKAQLREETENVSAEALKRSYMLEMPQDLQRRLENPSTANTFIQKILKRDIEGALSRLNTSIEKIENDSSLSNEETRLEIEKLITKQRKNLEDYDRIITQYGTVDGLAMAGRYAQTAGKTVVAVVTVETLALSLEKMWEILSNTLSSHGDVHEAIAATRGGEKNLLRDTAPSHDATHAPEAKLPPAETTGAPQTEAPVSPAESAQVEPTHPAVILETHGAAHTVNPDAIVHEGGSVEKVFRIQIEKDPALAEKLGFHGDIKDPQALHEFSGGAAHRLALDRGYVDASGNQIQITEADKVAYEIKLAGGKVLVTEKSISGEQFAVYDDKNAFGENSYNPYDKEVGASVHETIPENQHPITETTPTPIHTAPEATNEPETTTSSPEEIKPQRGVKAMDEVVRKAKIRHEAEAMHEKALKSQIEEKIDATKHGTKTFASEHAHGTTQRYGTHSDAHGGNRPYYGNNRYGNFYDARGGGYKYYFPGLNAQENAILNSNPEYAINHFNFNMSGEKLMDVYETSQKDIDYVFAGDTSDWGNLKNLNATKFLANYDPASHVSSPENSLAWYLQELKKYSGLTPKSGLFVKEESIAKFIARALQIITHDGKLEEFETDLRQ